MDKNCNNHIRKHLSDFPHTPFLLGSDARAHTTFRRTIVKRLEYTLYHYYHQSNSRRLASSCTRQDTTYTTRVPLHTNTPNNWFYELRGHDKQRTQQLFSNETVAPSTTQINEKLISNPKLSFRSIGTVGI